MINKIRLGAKDAAFIVEGLLDMEPSLLELREESQTWCPATWWDALDDQEWDEWDWSLNKPRCYVP